MKIFLIENKAKYYLSEFKFENKPKILSWQFASISPKKVIVQV